MNFTQLIKEEYIKLVESLTSFEITPNKARKSGNEANLVYLSIDKSYAISYANGNTKIAQKGDSMYNGLLFYVCLNEYEHHYGGDIWLSGYKNEIVENLSNYIQDSNNELDDLTETVLDVSGIGLDDTEQLTYILNNFIKKNDLSFISPIDWSNIQEQFGGYSEICVKRVSYNQIKKVEIYKNGEIIKTIKGGLNGKCDRFFYHGSPTQFWQELL